MAISEPEDLAILEQIDADTRLKIYRDFLFSSFLQTFKKYFSFERGTHQYSHYTWDDEVYTDFMISIFRSLEPINYKAGFSLYEELEDVNATHFI